MDARQIKIDHIHGKKDNNFLSDKNIKYIVQNYTDSEVVEVISFSLQQASDKMMGFLAEYWKLYIHAKRDKVPVQLYFFIKSVSRSNPSKANMVKELKLFDKEASFYRIVKTAIEIPGSVPWSARVAAIFENDLVLEDLTALGYKSNNKLDTLDIEHCKRALETIARFHSRTIIFEKRKENESKKAYTVLEDFKDLSNKGGYIGSNSWFTQCMTGALEAVKEFSKYGITHKDFNKIEHEWSDVWLSALQLADCSSGMRNVICHRDLWNNNLLYRYNAAGAPDGCILVDFQAISYQPPAGDVMLFLYCNNLGSRTRENNLSSLLQYYHSHLSEILETFGINIEDIVPLEGFMKSAEEQRKWGLILSACLLPQIWMDDDQVTEIFSDSERFDTILTKEKGPFIKRMMADSKDYKEKVLEHFEEIVWRYIL